MKVVFIKSVAGVAKQGEAKEVAEGYARNYLLPRKLAVVATSGTLHNIQVVKEQKQQSQEREHENLKELASEIEGKTLLFKAKAADENKIFGSVTPLNIAESLGKKVSFKIDKKQVDLAEPLRNLGDHKVNIKLAKDIIAGVSVIIEKE